MVKPNISKTTSTRKSGVKSTSSPKRNTLASNANTYPTPKLLNMVDPVNIVNHIPFYLVNVFNQIPFYLIHFFQHDLLQQSAARQAAFPETADDAVHRHLSEVRDMRLVRVLTRAGDDPDHVCDAIAEAVSEAVTDFGEGTSAEEAREAAMATWRQQREKERRGGMVRGLTQWSEDLLKQQVPEQWVREVVGGLIERVQALDKGGLEGEVDGEDEEEEEEEEEDEEEEWEL
ncbi:hypothetical protein QR685DRAFT_424520, partial [Neurospora intermedia]